MTVRAYSSLLPIVPLLGCRGAKQTNISWNAFLDDLFLYASELSTHTTDEESYVAKVRQVAKRLKLDEDRIKGILIENRPIDRKICDIQKAFNFEIALLSFAKGDSIPLHSHPDMTGVMLCATGEVSVNNFDFARSNSNGTATLKYIGNKYLTKHDTDSLTSHHGNIHEVIAAAPSQIIDIFSPPYNQARIDRTHWYENASPGQLWPGDDIQVEVLK